MSTTRAALRVRQLYRLAAKEWRLLVRNPHGLAVLFLMPAIFVLIMSLTLKNSLVDRPPLPTTGWLLEDTSAPAAEWVRQWQSRNPGQVFDSARALERALVARDVEAGVRVKAGWIGDDGRPRADQVEIWLGNRIQPAAAARLRAELSYSMVRAGMQIVAAEAGPFATAILEEGGSGELLAGNATPSMRYLYEIQSGRTMTAVQQSVPAWLVFGMFFVIIPIAGVLVQERNDGTLLRLATFGVTPGIALAGKFLAFILLNWVQLGFMLAVGRWLVPLFGGDSLSFDVHPGWFILMVVATSAAAVGLALAIAARSDTFEHAAALGGGLNVVLGAIAGVMVPRMLMPPTMQTLSEWSPMGWALDGLQAVFLGDPDMATILPRAALLGAFAALCLAIAWWPLRRIGRSA